MTTDANLESKTMVVTGATSGIGLATARALSGMGAYVIGVGRSAARCKQAQDAILTHHPSARITYLLADLSSQRQVRQLAAAIRDQVTSSGALPAGRSLIPAPGPPAGSGHPRSSYLLRRGPTGCAHQ
ncbi:MAG: SDR family NAD(P)-dependent oxidoreductase [Anaerolineales bacterium]